MSNTHLFACWPAGLDDANIIPCYCFVITVDFVLICYFVTSVQTYTIFNCLCLMGHICANDAYRILPGQLMFTM